MFVECAMAVVQVGDTGETVLWSWTIGPERGSLANFQILSHAFSGRGNAVRHWEGMATQKHDVQLNVDILERRISSCSGVYLNVDGCNLM